MEMDPARLGSCSHPRGQGFSGGSGDKNIIQIHWLHRQDFGLEPGNLGANVLDPGLGDQGPVVA